MKEQYTKQMVVVTTKSLISNCMNYNCFEMFVCFSTQNIEEEKKKNENCMPNIHETMQDIFGDAIHAAYPDLVDPVVAVTTSQQQRFGDYQCNSAMGISQVSLSRSR